jgi:hypothetical protein
MGLSLKEQNLQDIFRLWHPSSSISSASSDKQPSQARKWTHSTRDEDKDVS